MQQKCFLFFSRKSLQNIQRKCVTLSSYSHFCKTCKNFKSDPTRTLTESPIGASSKRKLTFFKKCVRNQWTIQFYSGLWSTLTRFAEAQTHKYFNPTSKICVFLPPTSSKPASSKLLLAEFRTAGSSSTSASQI